MSTLNGINKLNLFHTDTNIEFVRELVRYITHITTGRFSENMTAACVNIL